MIGLRTKREEKYPSANLEDLIALLNFSDQVIALERDQQSENDRDVTTLRILKPLFRRDWICRKIKYNLSTSRFTEHETKESPIFDPSTDF